MSDITLTNQCYENIQNDIIEGILEPGQKLTVEKLKKKYKVGHTPIREALSRLVDSYLVEMIDNRGFYVTALSEHDVRDTYRTFVQIENLALTQAIALGDEHWEAQIVAMLYQLGLVEKKSGNITYPLWRERNYAFHLALIAGCNSPCLLALREHIYKRFDRYSRIGFHMRQAELEMNYEEHEKLAQAVLKRDLTKASQLMTDHIFGSLEDVILLLKNKEMI